MPKSPIVTVWLVTLVGAVTFAEFSRSCTDTYAVRSSPGTADGGDGRIVDAITPAARPPAAEQTAPTETSSVLTVGDRKYTVYDYADPATKKFCGVIPEGLKTVRGLLAECNHAGGDSRKD